MELTIELTGRTPLIMHNPRLADPMDPHAKEISKYSKKRSKTEEDLEEIGRLEWLGGLYTDNGVISVPTACIRACLIQTARTSRQGKQVERAVIFREAFAELLYEGPSDLGKLYENGGFVYRTLVNVAKRKIVRVRPMFSPWQIRTEVVLIDSLMDRGDFVQVAELAGQIQGLCDNRTNGFGRFDVELV